MGFGWYLGPMDTLVASTHAATARMDVHEVARQLNAHLGPTLVAALAGIKDRKLPIRWAKPEGPTPGTDSRRRLQLAHRVWTAIAGAESDHVARSWFIGGNPLLDEDTPLTAIREDRGQDVIAALTAFLADQPAP